MNCSLLRRVLFGLSLVPLIPATIAWIWWDFYVIGRRRA